MYRITNGRFVFFFCVGSKNIRRSLRMHTGNDQQRLRRIPRAPNQLFPPAASGKQSLFPRVPQYTTGTIQTRVGQHYMGV